ncbi:MAG: beta-ketoacyl synthase [Bacteroidetes bacterium]|nr:beta-ketoacyl synthase [Bacteroidota bacterium]
MMIQTYLENSNIISPAGWDSGENLESVLSGRSGIGISSDRGLSPVDLPLARLDWDEVEKRFKSLPGTSEAVQFTRFEMLGILSVDDALKESAVDPADPETAFILSTTKGNVELMENPGAFEPERLFLWKSAELIARFSGIKSRPLVVSNACISGVSAMLTGRALIASGRYKHAIVLGADLLSRFIISGFQSFMSLSDEPCKPFDNQRNGLTLGEAAATIIISAQHGMVELVSGTTSNDANHISGPSRTGEGLLLAIRETLEGHEPPGVISAHGTATPYNDEMESIAITRAGLGGVAVNSLKGYFGHTLGAAGVVESIINIGAMKQGVLPATLGFSSRGVSGEINVSGETGFSGETNIPGRGLQGEVGTMLKIASGFGGCNAAALFKIRSWK